MPVLIRLFHSNHLVLLVLLLGLGGCKTGLISLGNDASDAEPPRDLHMPDLLAPLDMAQPPRCVELPKDRHAIPKPSLQNVGEPRILWQRTYPGTEKGLNHVMAMAGDRLAFTSGPTLWLLDRQQGDVVAHLTQGPEWSAPAQGPVADADGNFVFSTAAVYSVASDGTLRWTFSPESNIDPNEELLITSNFAMDPDGYLYFWAADGFLYSVNSGDGKVRWKRSVGLSPGDFPPQISNGGGDVFFFVNSSFSNFNYQPYSTETGQPLSPWIFDGKTIGGNPTYYGYLSGIRNPSHNDEIQAFFMDNCGRRLWSFPNQPGSSWTWGLIGFEGEILARGDANSENGYVYDVQGKRLRGPLPNIGYPQVLGADGTFYSFQCSASNQFLLTAYSWQTFDKQWTINLGNELACSALGGVLANDGVLYLASSTGYQKPVEVVAVQTQSPGLADTAQPSIPRDNRRTAWVK